MSRPGCAAPIALATSLEYWLGELDEALEARVEEHLLGCDDCTANLQSLVGLAGGIRGLVRQGAVRAVVTDAFVKRLAAQGLQLREYRVARGGSVFCTVAPGDQLMVARLEAPLAGVEQVDLVFLDIEGKGHERLRDVPFSPSSGEVLVTPRIEQVRALPASTARVQLLAVDRGGERVIGEYTFIHTPWPLA